MSTTQLSLFDAPAPSPAIDAPARPTPTQPDVEAAHARARVYGYEVRVSSPSQIYVLEPPAYGWLSRATTRWLNLLVWLDELEAGALAPYDPKCPPIRADSWRPGCSPKERVNGWTLR